jgi:recombination protein RecA
MLVCQPDSGEQALEVADSLIQTGQIDVIVVDSVAALVPRQELEGEMGQAQIGLQVRIIINLFKLKTIIFDRQLIPKLLLNQARLMSQAMRKLTASLAKSKTVLIFINQIRMKIGVMFGNPETTSGGTALKYYSSIRMEIRKSGTVKKGDEITASQMRVKVAKNKCAAPFKFVGVVLLFAFVFANIGFPFKANGV